MVKVKENQNNFRTGWTVNGYGTQSGECYFETEYQMFEIGTGNFGRKTFNTHLTQIAKPEKYSEPDATLEFIAIVLGTVDTRENCLLPIVPK